MSPKQNTNENEEAIAHRTRRRPGRPGPKMPVPGPQAAYAPLLGEELIGLASALQRPGARKITQQDVMIEVGLQRTRFTEEVRRGSVPIMKPTVEIIHRMLTLFPEFAIAREEYTPEAVLELMRELRPDDNYRMAHLAILTGHQTRTFPGKRVEGRLHPSTERMLRLLYKGLTRGSIEERQEFLAKAFETAFGVGMGHGNSPSTISIEGFTGYRDVRAVLREEQKAMEAKKPTSAASNSGAQRAG